MHVSMSIYVCKRETYILHPNVDQQVQQVQLHFTLLTTTLQLYSENMALDI